MSSAYRSFAHRVDIDVPVERVWRAFTDTPVLQRWTGTRATITPREKGRMQVPFGPGPAPARICGPTIWVRMAALDGAGAWAAHGLSPYASLIAALTSLRPAPTAAMARSALRTSGVGPTAPLVCQVVGRLLDATRRGR